MKTVEHFNATFEHIPTGVKVSADVLSFSVIFGTLLNHLPSIAAALSIVWTTIRIFETKTVQRLLSKVSLDRFRKRKNPDNSN